MAKKEKNFRITCTCDNAFTLAEGREESINEWLDSIDADRVQAIKVVVMSHYRQETSNGKNGLRRKSSLNRDKEVYFDKSRKFI